MAKKLYKSFFRQDQSLLHRQKNLEIECAWCTNYLVGQYLHQLNLLYKFSISPCRQSPGKDILIISLISTGQETQKEIVLGSPTLF